MNMSEDQKTKKEGALQNPVTQSIVGIVTVLILLVAFLYWQGDSGTLLIENSAIVAPIINLSGNTAGTLNALYVTEGDKVAANTPVALVGASIVTSKQSGVVVGVVNSIGAYFAPGSTVVSTIHLDDMRVVGTIDETKGLRDIVPGQKASFTVDAFGSKTYVGIVESISQTSDDTGVVFSISDKRPTKKFKVKVRYNIAQYPELKNGMSAKITVYLK